MSTTPLRDLIEQRLDLRWQEWAGRHPHLAEVIDRTRLLETSVTRLRDDPAFLAAMRQADIDEAQMRTAMEVIELIDKWVGRLLPL